VSQPPPANILVRYRRQSSFPSQLRSPKGQSEQAVNKGADTEPDGMIDTARKSRLRAHACVRMQKQIVVWGIKHAAPAAREPSGRVVGVTHFIRSLDTLQETDAGRSSHPEAICSGCPSTELAWQPNQSEPIDRF